MVTETRNMGIGEVFRWLGVIEEEATTEFIEGSRGHLSHSLKKKLVLVP